MYYYCFFVFFRFSFNSNIDHHVHLSNWKRYHRASIHHFHVFQWARHFKCRRDEWARFQVLPALVCTLWGVSVRFQKFIFNLMLWHFFPCNFCVENPISRYFLFKLHALRRIPQYVILPKNKNTDENIF